MNGAGVRLAAVCCGMGHFEDDKQGNDHYKKLIAHSSFFRARRRDYPTRGPDVDDNEPVEEADHVVGDKDLAVAIFARPYPYSWY